MNISKQKRDNLITKIKEIRTFIASAPQDKNSGNLLTYLRELEKEVKGKKYGLVFEEHREAIDDLLDNNIPVLTEEKELFINNEGNVNYLIEGDNLAALYLLLKTHRGKIDLIYIDPPYNTEEIQDVRKLMVLEHFTRFMALAMTNIIIDILQDLNEQRRRRVNIIKVFLLTNWRMEHRNLPRFPIFMIWRVISEIYGMRVVFRSIVGKSLLN